MAARLERDGASVRVASRSGPVRFDWAGLDGQAGVDSQAKTYGQAGLAVEDALRHTTAAWTILRPSWFDQNFSEDEVIGATIAEGELRLPTGTGREPFIDVQDIAEVAVAALTGDGHAGRIYELSGPHALTWGEAIAEIAQACGRAVRFTPISDEQYRAEMTAAGLPDDHIEINSALFAHIRHGRGAALSDDVRRVLGRAPADFTSYARRLYTRRPCTRRPYTRHLAQAADV
ncbi:SDR family NAD(P)-dependent oxidoreductase [Streptomyces chrestomyceticus]|uniref:SDR family NAD(P)-dependent oxidoreductase n=1 Tax=Streptomyces chrestomyceticus TaxID=68185 RepID=UPI00368869C1